MAKSLNSMMEFDHVIRVREDGTVEDSSVRGVHAPEINIGSDPDGQILAEHERELIADVRHQGWTLLTGYTRQYMSKGSPIMHASEYVGGELEEHIRSNPGLYVVTEASMLDYDKPAGWLVCFREMPPVLEVQENRARRYGTPAWAGEWPVTADGEEFAMIQETEHGYRMRCGDRVSASLAFRPTAQAVYDWWRKEK